jgi:hypothetical protein
MPSLFNEIESYTTEGQFAPIQEVGYGLRADGTKKGSGYFGELKRPDGKVSTEISIGVSIDGKETEIPLLVPTLSKEQVEHALSGEPPTEEMKDIAVSHAMKRMKEGKSPFAEQSLENEITEITKSSGLFDEIESYTDTAPEEPEGITWGEVLKKAPASGLAHVNVGLARLARDTIKIADMPASAVRKAFGIEGERPDVKFLEDYMAGEQKRQEVLDVSEEISQLPHWHPKRIIGTGLQAVPQVAAVAGGALMGAPFIGGATSAATMLGAIAYGPSAEEAKAEGANEIQQVLHGITSAQIEVLTELPVFKAVGQIWRHLKGAGVAKKAGISFAKRLLTGLGLYGKGLALETVQEVEAYLGGQISKRLHYDPNATINFKDAVEAGYGGLSMAATVGIAGVPGMAVKLAGRRGEKPSAARETLLDEDEQDAGVTAKEILTGEREEPVVDTFTGEESLEAEEAAAAIEDEALEVASAVTEPKGPTAPKWLNDLTDTEISKRIDNLEKTQAARGLSKKQTQNLGMLQQELENRGLPAQEAKEIEKPVTGKAVKPALTEPTAEVAREPVGVEAKEPWKTDTKLKGREYQETYPEKTVHENWDKANSPRYDFEGAGDILREFQKKDQDPHYINEKLGRVKRFVEGHLNNTLHFDDSLDAAIKYEFKKLNRLISQYESQPVSTESQKTAKSLILNIMKGNFKEAQTNLDAIENNVEEWTEQALKPLPPKPPKAKPSEAVTKEIKGEGIPEAVKKKKASLYFTVSKAEAIIAKDVSKLSDEALQKNIVKIRDYERYTKDTALYRKQLIEGGYFVGIEHPDATGLAPKDIWLGANLTTALDEALAEQKKRQETTPEGKPKIEKEKVEVTPEKKESWELDRKEITKQIAVPFDELSPIAKTKALKTAKEKKLGHLKSLKDHRITPEKAYSILDSFGKDIKKYPEIQQEALSQIIKTKSLAKHKNYQDKMVEKGDTVQYGMFGDTGELVHISKDGSGIIRDKKGELSDVGNTYRPVDIEVSGY